MNVKNYVLKVLEIILPVFFMGYFLESFSHVSSALGAYFEITTQLLPLVMSFSIFVITWYAFNKSMDNHSLFLGAVFFCIGLLDVYHLLSYPFMPAFLTPNSLEKGAKFAIVAMMVSALLFFASVFIHKNSYPGLINKTFLFVMVVAISFISLMMVLFFPDYLPAMLDRDGGPSSGFLLIQFLASAIIVYAGYLYAIRLRETDQKNILCLLYGFAVFISSYLVYPYHGYSGHLLKAAGFYFIYLALYKSSVEEPFKEETRAESKLRYAAEERYRYMVDNANDAIITTDLEGRITSWNRSAENILGRTVKEAMGAKLAWLTVPQDMQSEFGRIINIVMSGGIVSGFETVLQRKDGIRMNVSLTVSPLRDANNEMIGLSCIIRDITDRLQAEMIREENLRLSVTIKAKSEFLTLMSHDLGTPLNAMIGFSELLKQGIPGNLNKKQEQYVENVITSSKRMLDIINDILDLGRAETGKIDLVIEKIPVPQTIEETINLLKEKGTKHNVEMKREFDPELEFIEADRQRFKQILFNLASNAVKYSKKEGGTVTLTTKKEKDMARISVSDTGVGIKDEDMEKLFKPFEQLDLGISSTYGSTGLGLVITKKLVELHGGKIMVESKWGEGTTFTFWLPITARRPV
ncbi:MAG: ATP-binding protein [Candidatus Methanoperedens sp.]|nr:ATP-binding protein [Candidatus Methanoperedens sp.]MCZ7371435.1 ATP-binding protein [Candidatus Methanoperedens sp.]